ncbi:MAG: RNA polymerase sigma-70 factor [Bacteroidota bacterium]|nr:RNA polymerase sigma-70 factor [Bacteroidota bacterium]
MKTNFVSETEWILALKEGNLLAFNELFDRYGKRLYYFSKGYLKSPESAEEIVQEVFLKIWDNRIELSACKSIESYLFTITRNGILNTIRKSKSELAYLDYVKNNPGKNVLLEEELNFNELEKAYHEAVEHLSPRRKEIYQLSREHSFSNAEIAIKMNISVKTVENQMTSALSEIRRNLRSLGFSAIIFLELFK